MVSREDRMRMKPELHSVVRLNLDRPAHRRFLPVVASFTKDRSIEIVITCSLGDLQTAALEELVRIMDPHPEARVILSFSIGAQLDAAIIDSLRRAFRFKKFKTIHFGATFVWKTPPKADLVLNFPGRIVVLTEAGHELEVSFVEGTPASLLRATVGPRKNPKEILLLEVSQTQPYDAKAAAADHAESTPADDPNAKPPTVEPLENDRDWPDKRHATLSKLAVQIGHHLPLKVNTFILRNISYEHGLDESCYSGLDTSNIRDLRVHNCQYTTHLFHQLVFESGLDQLERLTYTETKSRYRNSGDAYQDALYGPKLRHVSLKVNPPLTINLGDVNKDRVGDKYQPLEYDVQIIQ